MANLAQRLVEISKNYSYNDLSWIIGKSQFLMFPNELCLMIPGFYSPNGMARKGSCTELMLQAYADIHQESPHLEGKVYRVAGADPLFFSRPSHPEEIFGRIKRGDHHFLAITRKKIISDGEKLSGEDAKNALMEGDALLFDPSFGALEHIKESSYLITDIWAPGRKVGYPAGGALFGVGHPSQVIGRSGDYIVTLAIHIQKNGNNLNIIPRISLLGKNEPSQSEHSLDSKYLSEACGSIEGLRPVLDHLMKEIPQTKKGNTLSTYTSACEYDGRITRRAERKR